MWRSLHASKSSRVPVVLEKLPVPRQWSGQRSISLTITYDWPMKSANILIWRDSHLCGTHHLRWVMAFLWGWTFSVGPCYSSCLCSDQGAISHLWQPRVAGWQEESSILCISSAHKLHKIYTTSISKSFQENYSARLLWPSDPCPHLTPVTQWRGTNLCQMRIGHSLLTWAPFSLCP